MTNEEKLKWLNAMNAHLAAGGEVEYNWETGWKSTNEAPQWFSTPELWRIVPLPRKATIRVAYRFNSVFEAVVLTNSSPLGDAWKVATIEVTE
jgi:hypothetical protein